MFLDIFIHVGYWRLGIYFIETNLILIFSFQVKPFEEINIKKHLALRLYRMMTKNIILLIEDIIWLEWSL